MKNQKTLLQKALQADYQAKVTQFTDEDFELVTAYVMGDIAMSQVAKAKGFLTKTKRINSAPTYSYISRCAGLLGKNGYVKVETN